MGKRFIHSSSPMRIPQTAAGCLLEASPAGEAPHSTGISFAFPMDYDHLTDTFLKYQMKEGDPYVKSQHQ